MKLKHIQIIHIQSMPLPGWYQQWVPWITSGFACVGYLSGVLTTPHLTLVSGLLLTGTYGAWLVIYWLVIAQIGQRRFEARPHLGFLLALFCLACASQFISLPATNVYWLPLLPALTVSLMTMIKPQPLSLGLSCVLCLSSYLAIRHIVPDWDVSGQMLLLLPLCSTACATSSS